MAPASNWGKIVCMTDGRGDMYQDAAARGSARRFHQLPNLVVPQDFDAPLPHDEYTSWYGATNDDQETA